MTSERRLPLRQAVLVHQVHPAKLATDVGTSVVSLALLWHGYRRSAMALHFAAPVLGSAIVLATADLPRLAATRRGRYVQEHMPPAAQALRLAGDALTVWGARRHRPGLIAAGIVVVAAGWSHGPFTRATAAYRRSRRPPPPG
jgi:hypothetical protein